MLFDAGVYGKRNLVSNTKAQNIKANKMGIESAGRVNAFSRVFFFFYFIIFSETAASKKKTQKQRQ